MVLIPMFYLYILCKFSYLKFDKLKYIVQSHTVICGKFIPRLFMVNLSENHGLKLNLANNKLI